MKYTPLQKKLQHSVQVTISGTCQIHLLGRVWIMKSEKKRKYDKFWYLTFGLKFLSYISASK